MSIVAVAGRRIDAPGAHPARFPLANVPQVKQRVCRALDEMKATALTSSAANGADLIAAQCALERSLPLHIVLPFDAGDFKRWSVMDRPGDWATLFERVVAAAKMNGTLTTLSGSPGEDSSYVAANRAILDTAASYGSAKALIIWDGYSRGNSDLTASLADEAASRGIHVHYILTVL